MITVHYMLAMGYKKRGSLMWHHRMSENVMLAARIYHVEVDYVGNEHLQETNASRVGDHSVVTISEGDIVQLYVSEAAYAGLVAICRVQDGVLSPLWKAAQIELHHDTTI